MPRPSLQLVLIYDQRIDLLIYCVAVEYSSIHDLFAFCLHSFRACALGHGPVFVVVYDGEDTNEIDLGYSMN